MISILLILSFAFISYLFAITLGSSVMGAVLVAIMMGIFVGLVILTGAKDD